MCSFKSSLCSFKKSQGFNRIHVEHKLHTKLLKLHTESFFLFFLAIDFKQNQNYKNKRIKTKESKQSKHEIMVHTQRKRTNPFTHSTKCMHKKCLTPGCRHMKLAMDHFKKCPKHRARCKICKLVCMFRYHHDVQKSEDEEERKAVKSLSNIRARYLEPLTWYKRSLLKCNVEDKTTPQHAKAMKVLSNVEGLLWHTPSLDNKTTPVVQSLQGQYLSLLETILHKYNTYHN